MMIIYRFMLIKNYNQNERMIIEIEIENFQSCLPLKILRLYLLLIILSLLINIRILSLKEVTFLKNNGLEIVFALKL